MSTPSKKPAPRIPPPEESRSVLDGLRKLRLLVTPEDKRRFLWLLPIITFMAVLQVVGIASVMPFLALVADPEMVFTDARLKWVYDLLGFRTTRSFLAFVGGASLVLLVLSNVLAAVTEYLQLRFSWRLNHSLSVKMLSTYLAKPYVFFLGQNTAGLATNILAEVKQLVSGFVMSGANLVSRSVVTILILALLIVVNPVLALVTFGFLGSAYGLVFWIMKRAMADAGKSRSRADRARYRAASEALSGIKDIKLLGREAPFLERYTRWSREYENSMAKQQVFVTMPRYAFETIAFGGMLIIVLVSLLSGSGIQAILPTLGVYAFASYRLLPALQVLFQSISSMRFSVTAVDVLYRDLDISNDGESAPVLRPGGESVEPMPFKDEIRLENVSFRYPESERDILADFDLKIRANTTVGIVGTTGAGKTTTVDILLGLLEPTTGHLSVDGVKVTDENMRSWQRNLGYVPQFIYLADDTVAGNIAFGVPAEEVDVERLERAAKLAHVHDFIVTELQNGYQTFIGERGIKLSGGQRQRIGIARALYHDPAMLVFDEATSALDGVTEEAIFQAVSMLGKSKTIVMIAHRISTVRACDVIYLLDRGRVIDFGTYDDLLVRNDDFRAMALGGHAVDTGLEPAAGPRG